MKRAKDIKGSGRLLRGAAAAGVARLLVKTHKQLLHASQRATVAAMLKRYKVSKSLDPVAAAHWIHESKCARLRTQAKAAAVRLESHTRGRAVLDAWQRLLTDAGGYNLSDWDDFKLIVEACSEAIYDGVVQSTPAELRVQRERAPFINLREGVEVAAAFGLDLLDDDELMTQLRDANQNAADQTAAADRFTSACRNLCHERAGAEQEDEDNEDRAYGEDDE